MNGKQYAIEKLEKALINEDEELEKCYRNIKAFKTEVAHYEKKQKEAISGIGSLRDAIHKLKGLDNLEEAKKL